MQIVVASTTIFLAAGRFGLTPSANRLASPGLKLQGNDSGLKTGDPAGFTATDVLYLGTIGEAQLQSSETLQATVTQRTCELKSRTYSIGTLVLLWEMPCCVTEAVLLALSEGELHLQRHGVLTLQHLCRSRGGHRHHPRTQGEQCLSQKDWSVRSLALQQCRLPSVPQTHAQLSLILQGTGVLPGYPSNGLL